MPTPDPVPSTPQHPEPQITLVTGNERLTQREQLEAFIRRAAETKQPLRLRLPITLYDYGSDNRGYVPLRDASWNFQLPAERTSPADVERLITALGKCIAAIAELGTAAVIDRLTTPD